MSRIQIQFNLFGILVLPKKHYVVVYIEAGEFFISTGGSRMNTVEEAWGKCRR